MNITTIGMYTSLIYNIYVATSVTSQGRALTSSATMFFESFLANNVKFGSLNEVIEFINNIKQERYEWKFNDYDWLDHDYLISPEDVFGKLVLTCGYRWVPNQEELEIIWTIVNNLDQELLNRVWYKNNLYEFMENKKVFEVLNRILHNLEHPLFTAADVPSNVADDVKLLAELLTEYVYYHYMVIDRIDRTNNMIKSVICITDTDSCILSLDAWYRYVSQKISGEEYRLCQDLGSPITFFDYTEEDEELGKPKPWEEPISFLPKKYDYNFKTDEIVEVNHIDNPVDKTAEDNMRYTIINIMAYIIDRLINDYMIRFCTNTHSVGINYQRDCRILMKNEFFRFLKSYR